MGLGTVTPKKAGNPTTIAFNFLKNNSVLFGLDRSNQTLHHDSTFAMNGITHVIFKQVYHGIPIKDGEYRVHLRPNNQIDMVNGNYYPFVKSQIEPRIDINDISKIVKALLSDKINYVETSKPELVIVPTDNKFRLTWKTMVITTDPEGEWYYYIDAINGDVVYSENLVMSEGVAVQSPLQIPNGNVYLQNPYINSGMSNVVLLRLLLNGYLSGTYANIKNDAGDEAYEYDNVFTYRSANTHFDEVNVYYHLDHFRSQYINPLGYSGVSQVTAHVHWSNTTDARYYSGSGKIYFGDGSGDSNYNDFAKEDKIIYHEYIHAIVHSINNNIESSYDEEGAINEGSADYFAGSFTGRTQILNYVHPGHERDMANPVITSYSQ